MAQRVDPNRHALDTRHTSQALSWAILRSIARKRRDGPKFQRSVDTPTAGSDAECHLQAARQVPVISASVALAE